MEHRYALRFESGERRGESIPITASGLTVGRKPGNTLQILDNSVSGAHAELTLAGDTVVLKDLGSTNGTRVGAQRVLEQRLNHGDVVLFGNIKLVFLDQRRGAVAPRDDDGIQLEEATEPEPAARFDAAASPVTAIQPQPEGLARISQDRVARARKRSFSGVLVLAALAVLGAGTWFWLNRGGSTAGRATRAVAAVAGDLLPGTPSFEGDADTWTPAEGAPAAFLRAAAARRSGVVGLQAELASVRPGAAGAEWALARSPTVRANPERELEARVFLRTQGAVEARLGIEFTETAVEGAPRAGPIVAWTRAISDAADFVEVVLQAPVPAGYAEARVLLLARSLPRAEGGGSVQADDPSLVESAKPATPVAYSENGSLFVHGDPPTTAHLHKPDRVLLTGIAFVPSGAADASGAAALEVTSEKAQIVVAARGAGDHALHLRAESVLARARIATLSADGYRTHAGDFEQPGVTSLLLGAGTDMVRLRFASPARVRGVAEGAAARFEVTAAGGLTRFELQLDFKDERRECGNIAHAAHAAQDKGDLGTALAEWSRLLDAYPFEEALVDEAEAARARLVQQGLGDLRDVKAEVERARFFRLADLHRKCREKALSVAKRYQGSEVEKEAKKLAADVEVDVALLESDLTKVERERLRSILAGLQAHKADGLAAEVRAYLTDRLGDKP